MELLTPEQVAEHLGVSTETLRVWRRDKRGPKPVYLSARTIRYRAQEVWDWIVENERKQENHHEQTD